MRLMYVRKVTELTRKRNVVLLYVSSRSILNLFCARLTSTFLTRVTLKFGRFLQTVCVGHKFRGVVASRSCTMEEFIYENNVNDMRARDLRNLLVQKLGVSQALVNRIMDRNELKEMVTSIMYKKLQQQSHDEMLYKLYVGTAIVGVLTLLYICRKYLFKIVEMFHSALSEFSYKSAHKVKLVMFNFQHSNFLPAVALLISLLFETVVMWIQTSILLGWIIPHGHVIRRFFFPTFSFPVSAGALLKAGSGGKVSKPLSTESSSGGLGEAVSNFSLDLGPMITIAVLNFLINRLDEYAAGVVLQNVQSKEEKKAFKKFFGGARKPRKDRPDKDKEGQGDRDDKAPAQKEGAYAGDSRDSEYVFEEYPADEKPGEDLNAQFRQHQQDQNQHKNQHPNHASHHQHDCCEEHDPAHAETFESKELDFGPGERPAYSTAANDGEGWLD